MDESNFSIYSSSREAWDVMYQAILEAKKSIYWELYIFVDDTAGKPFFDILETKAKSGVDVKLVIDSMGSFWLSRERIKSLREAGVDLHFFQEGKNKYRSWWKRLWTRTHRKILIIDEEDGFVGGVNIQKDMQDWLDIQIKVTGKAVHSLLRSFAKNYVICGGDKQKVRHLLKYKFRILHDKSEWIFDEPHEYRSQVRVKYVEAILKARERIILFSPYYFPDKKFLLALWRARKRGVKIDLLIPFRADIKILMYVSYGLFSLMRRYGVNIHLSNKMMHGKGIIVDEDEAIVGSTNIEQTGFYDNYEANIKLKDKEIIKKLKSIVDKWMSEAKNLPDEEWEKRSRWQKMKEWVALKLYKVWNRNH